MGVQNVKLLKITLAKLNMTLNNAPVRRLTTLQCALKNSLKTSKTLHIDNPIPASLSAPPVST